MASRGFNTKTPTIKRILKEAAELESQPSPDYHATPLEDNLFEWHFTLRGRPAPSPYAAGIYHGRIVLPATYPLRPPSFRFLTPTGRFEVNREICLSISGHHEETWQPAWGIRTALVAIRSFMDSEAKGQVGGLECDRGVRERMAGESAGWRCGGCGKSNAEILKERVELCGEEDGERKEEAVPKELRLAYRDELGEKKDVTSASESSSPAVAGASSAMNGASAAPAIPPQPARVAPAPAPAPQPTRTIPPPTPPVQQRQVVQQQSPDRSLAWIDTCIYGVVVALLFMVLRKFT
ncbi:hypothetical protein N0V90_001444 [Kalmusia sp. IMI 367209]|nr:hypothetical protein N0V90_001444 [Kalmusia sp. IMI 367209]